MLDEQEYLQPGFDPNVLKVAELRNLFVQYDIPYASGAKKADLVALFESDLRPRAKRILAQAARVKRTSMGIENVPSRESSIADDDDQDDVPEPVKTPMRRAQRKASATPSAASRTSKASRRSTRSAVAEAATDEDEDEDDGRSTRESTARASGRSTRTPGAESVASENERPRNGRRKTRLSDFDPPAHIKEEDTREAVNSVEESPFTTHNPFQSGSSPLAPTPASRKSTTRKSQSRRRTGDQTPRIKQEDDEATPVPKSRRSEGATARLSNGVLKTDRSRTPTLEPSEEFTPDEQLALEQEEAETGKAVLPRRRKQRSSAAKVGPWIVLTTILAGVAGWWRQEKVAVGFCGYGSSADYPALSKQNVQLPEWAQFLQPDCDECPQHGLCFPNYGVRCQQDYVKVAHPLSLGGLVPLPPTCEPDSEKVRKVKSVADRAVAELREQKAKYECGIKDESGKTVSSPEISEETLKAKVSAKRRRGMTEIEFEALWDGAIDEVLGREEVTRVPDGRSRSDSIRNAGLGSTSLARLPIGCTVRRSARLALARYRVTIASIVAVVIGLAYMRRLIIASRTDKARVPGLVSVVLDRLATQAAIHAEGRSPEPWISAGQLRDDILRDEFSTERRARLWKRVQNVVEFNANVRAGVKESRSGEVSRVWEWIGVVPSLDDGYERSASRSRLSYGSASGNLRANSASPGNGEVKREDADERQVRRWDEGRPVY